MIFRKAEIEDMADILAIICQAQEDLRKQGVDQWQDGYPNEEIVRADIKRGENWVLAEDGKVTATVVFSFRTEPSYQIIYEGAWKSENPYAVIHRIAVSRDRKQMGAATRLLENIVRISREAGISSVRIDTHRDNKAMQSWIKKNGFAYCGVIHLQSSNAERKAYELKL